MRIDIESDEDIEGGFAFFSEEKGAGKYKSLLSLSHCILINL